MQKQSEAKIGVYIERVVSSLENVHRGFVGGAESEKRRRRGVFFAADAGRKLNGASTR